MHYKEKHNREQLMMVSYDTMISQDNPVRLIDLMCKKFVSDNPLRDEWKGNKKDGRKSYPPDSMLGLLVYGYFNGISSSRKLERETYRNIEVLWLMEGLQPDHWTVCEFRRTNQGPIKDFLKTFRRFLLEESYATGDKLVFDGTKVKAYAKREMLTSKSIREKLENIDKSIAEYLAKLESNDSYDNELEVAKAEIEELREKVAKLEKSKSKLEYASKELADSGKKRISPNDKDAVLVKGRDGKYPGYNVQAGVEPKGHFIMMDDVTTEPNDQQQLVNCVESATEEIGNPPKEVSADKGYGNTTQILEIEENGKTQCYIPLSETQRDKETRKGFEFEYDKESDIYTCPQGKKLHLFLKNKKHHGAVYNVYKCHECDNCPMRKKCTKSKTGRTVNRNINQKIIDSYRKKLESDYAKEKINERKQVVEHPFGTIKWLMGKFNFLLTGKEKVQIEFDLYSTAYNIKRLVNCAPTTELMAKMIRYNWAMA